MAWRAWPCSPCRRRRRWRSRSRRWPPTCRSRWSPVAPGDGSASSPRSGPRRSTTSPPACAPACPSPRRSPGCPRAVPSRCARPSEPSAVDYQASGRFEDALLRLKDRLADPVGDRVVEGLRIAREVGGGELGRLLRNLSGYLRDDARTRQELESRQAWTVNGARLAVAAPWLVLLTMAFQSEVIQRYSSTAGVLVLAIGAGSCAVAYRVMVRIGRLPTERRILA